MSENTNNQKSAAALREEKVLEFWNSQNIFEKSLDKNKDGAEFVFYEGPPTANAKPALHHLEARAFKDTLPRYKTMQGFHVRRKAGWDTHGLPVELQIEKKLGLQSKKDIETFGVAKFNAECKESVHEYIGTWQNFTERMGYWVDFEDAYYTYNPQYMESLWSIVKKISDRGLLYKDYRIVPWCARCGTGLSSHELAQGYEDVKDLSVTAKFRLVGEENVYILAWTTTPWTLPGNVALAVGEDITYVQIKKDTEFLILAKERLSIIEGEYEIIKEITGSDLAGLSYEPLYKIDNIEHAYKIQVADFVTTTDGTGIVHIAPMYGADDFGLATKNNLPKVHTVDDSGHFIASMTPEFLQARFVKTEDVAIDIIKDLAHRGLLFKKEKYEHSYPHCWRCKTPLIYYARDSWYVRMSSLRDDLIKANEGINWNPNHIQDGRFGEWIREVKDWAFSRERYWGTPLPVWTNANNELLVVDSIDTLKSYTKKSGNEYFLMRHGETIHNVAGTWNCNIDNPDALTDAGVQGIVQSIKNSGQSFDMIIASPFLRTQKTAQIVASELGMAQDVILSDARIAEWNVGAEFDGMPMEEYFSIRNAHTDRYEYKVADGESYADVVRRTGEFLYEIEQKYAGKKILIVSHGAPLRALELHTKGISFESLFKDSREYRNFDNAEIRHIDFTPLPHSEKYEIDLHRPYIDSVSLIKDGVEYNRVKEVMDVWFDSGAMPFAQEHFPFNQNILYPADFISEAIDQTRGWFYTLLAVGTLMERGSPYKNVICLGHLLDKDGKKMSKSIGNIVEPFEQMEKFGVDAVRFWMYSVNQPGESKNYDEKSVAEIQNKVFSLTYNVLSFYEMYRDQNLEKDLTVETLNTDNVLDDWIITKLNILVSSMTEDLDNFELFRPTRAIKDFIDDLSTWYVRRSRDRLRDNDVDAKKALYVVLKTLAQLFAPFAPFTAEDLWQKLKTEKDELSVHLSVWPKAGSVDIAVIEEMEKVRTVCTEGNALRKKIGIAVKQPLASFSMSHDGLQKYYTLIQDELNVKAILVGDFALDTTITPELKREGEYRELVRSVQDLRKEKGLLPGDIISLSITQTMHDTIADIEIFKKTVQAESVLVGEELSLEIKEK
ncbi:MAG: class I tRNA ligase family protein [bacterium]